MKQSQNCSRRNIWFRNLKRIRPIPNLRQQPSKSVKQHSHEEDEIAWDQSGPKVANGTQRPSGPLLPGKTLSYLFEQSIRAWPFANAAQPFGFFQKLTFRGISAALVAAAGSIANDACGQLNRPRVDGNPVLLDEQKLSPVSDSDNNRRTGSSEPVHVFPATLFDECQKVAGVKNEFHS